MRSLVLAFASVLLAALTVVVPTRAHSATKPVADGLDEFTPTVLFPPVARSASVDDLIVDCAGYAGTRWRVSDAHKQSVRETLAHVPPTLLQVLRDSGCKVYVAPRYIDLYPALQGKAQKAYGKNSTYDHVSAAYDWDSKAIFACQFYRYDQTGEWFEEGDVASALRHEIGHALDDYLHEASRTAAFQAAYRADLADMREENRKRFAYYTQGVMRRKESFAEVCSYVIGERRWATRDVVSYFPRTLQAIRRALAPLVEQASAN